MGKMEKYRRINSKKITKERKIIRNNEKNIVKLTKMSCK